MTADLRPEQPTVLADDECGHLIATIGGDVQHHEIPDDGAPHAPTSECGCGPQRYLTGGHLVYEHVDQERC